MISRLLAAALLLSMTACSQPAAEPGSMFLVESDQPAPTWDELSALAPEFNETLDADAGASVVCVLSADCQATAGVLSRLKRLASVTARANFFGVVVSPHETLDDFKRGSKLAFPIVDDCKQQIASRLSASHTPSFYVFDRDGTLRFSGPLDDSTFDAGAVREQYVASAIRALLDGSEPPASLTPVGRPVLPNHEH
jgi:hypothetical protein